MSPTGRCARTRKTPMLLPGREAATIFTRVSAIVQDAWTNLRRWWPRYKTVDYVGAPDAERVIVLMGSGCEARMKRDYLVKKGEKSRVESAAVRPF